ncbi:hypothetical protein ACFX2F_012304 [Malus domestica]
MASLPTVDVGVSRYAAWTVRRVRSRSRLLPRSSYSDLELSHVLFWWRRDGSSTLKTSFSFHQGLKSVGLV